MNLDSLDNPGMLDAMYIDYRTYVNKSVWCNKEMLWKKWIRL